jgi:hypothetical protein
VSASHAARCLACRSLQDRPVVLAPGESVGPASSSPDSRTNLSTGQSRQRPEDMLHDVGREMETDRRDEAVTDETLPPCHPDDSADQENFCPCHNQDGA